MRTVPVIAVAWVATVVGAWLLGGSAGKPSTGGGADAAEVARLRDRVAELERAGPRPGLATSGWPAAPNPSSGYVETAPADATKESRPGPTKPAHEPAVPLSLAGVTDAGEASRRLLAFVEAKLAEGPAGHLEILRALNEQLFDRKSRNPLFQGPEEEMAPLIYPWVRMAVTHEAEVVALVDTVFKTMAESPAAFGDLDENTLEAFTEGLAPAIPGTVDAATLDRFRGYARKMLETPESAQSPAIQDNRGEVKRLLEGAWAPRVTVEEATARLRDPGLSLEDALRILRRLPPEAWSSVDVAAVLGPALDRGDWKALVFPRVPLDAKTLAALDAHALGVWSPAKNPSWILRYLWATQRTSWETMRPAIEAGMARGGPGADEFAKVLPQVSPLPPKDDVRSLLDRYPVSAGVREILRKAFRLDE